MRDTSPQRPAAPAPAKSSGRKANAPRNTAQDVRPPRRAQIGTLANAARFCAIVFDGIRDAAELAEIFGGSLKSAAAARLRASAETARIYRRKNDAPAFPPRAESRAAASRKTVNLSPAARAALIEEIRRDEKTSLEIAREYRIHERNVRKYADDYAAGGNAARAVRVRKKRAALRAAFDEIARERLPRSPRTHARAAAERAACAFAIFFALESGKSRLSISKSFGGMMNYYFSPKIRKELSRYASN